VAVPDITQEVLLMAEENRELGELIDSPRERLDVEYKAWLDLSDNETRAKFARHLCALANYGGGYLIFGINDDMTPTGPRPADGTGPYDQDTFSGIVKRYLKPSFQVALYEVPSALTGVLHPVIWVPSHEAVPVCSVRDGPHNAGKPVGISQGTYYTRAPGPESVAVATPELWAPIIRRCVLHERQALLAGLEPLLRSPGKPVTEPDAPLRTWHDAAHRRFLELADVDPLADQLKRAHYQFSYQINVADGQQLDMGAILDELRRMGHEVQDLVDPGWTMFWVFDVPELAPRSGADPALGETEFLECSLIKPDIIEMTLPDFWRVAPTGMATLIRPYREDRRDSGPDFKPGTWLWPNVMAREIAEVVRHARAFAERFPAPESVSFRAEWRGLQGRSLKDPQSPLFRRQGRQAQSDSRVVTRTVPITDLTSRWAEITADILSTVTRMFDATFSVSSQEVNSWSKKFRR
jgi:hypothetical protein